MTEPLINVELPAEWERDAVPIAFGVNGVRVDLADGQPLCALVGVEVSPPGGLDGLAGPLGSHTYGSTDTDWGVVTGGHGRAICLEVGLDAPAVPRVRLLFTDLQTWLPKLRAWGAPSFFLADHTDPRMIDAALNGPAGPVIQECPLVLLPVPAAS